MAHPAGDATAATPTKVEVDWVWRSSRGFFVSVDRHAFGPITVNQLLRFPRWLFRGRPA